MALLGLVLAGCASAVASCVPEGVAPRAAWQIALAAPVPQCQGCVAAWYRAGDQSLGVLWVRGLLARVDSDPRDLRAPVWEDPGIVVPGTGFEARADPVQTCRWRPWAPRSF